MDNKTINFHLYRYHLLPIDNKSKQIELFNEEVLTYDELKEKKNDFFREVLNEVASSKNNSHPLKLEHTESDYFLFKIAQKKTTIITQNFENIAVDNEPFVYVIINNDSNVQKIAISENLDAFSKPTVTRNALKSLFNRHLQKYGLNIEIEQMYDSDNFWNIIDKYKNQITYINFQFVKPNLANISKSLPKAFKDFSDDVNSHESQIIIKAPEKGTLDNIDKKNKAVEGLVDYTSNGAGTIKLKVKNIRKQLNTEESPVIFQVKELDIEGPANQVIKLYKTIVEE